MKIWLMTNTQSVDLRVHSVLGCAQSTEPGPSHKARAVRNLPSSLCWEYGCGTRLLSPDVLEASLSRIEFCFGAQCSIEELRSNADFYSPSTDHFRVIPADTFERFDEDGISSVGMSFRIVF